jgi:hypothetical protein
MTYRNDHEAALARIDALEHELAEMRATPAPAPIEPLAPRRRGRTGLVLTMCTVGLFGGIVGGFVLGASGDEARASHPHAAATKPAAPAHRDIIIWCADAIHYNSFVSDTHDPHAMRQMPAEPIGSAGTSCRDELDEYVTLPDLNAGEREALWQWALQEDELAGARSRIEVYYANDPAKLDSYASANQLWREYDRAYYARYGALRHWRTSYTR